MNTKQLNLVEMSPMEMRETEGGILPLLIGAALLLGGCASSRYIVKRPLPTPPTTDSTGG